MRKLLILLLFAFTGIHMFAGDVVITVSDLTWGENNELVVSMTNDVDVNGFQMDVVLPDGLSFSSVKGRIEPIATERLEGMTVMCSAMAGGKYRFVVFSLSGKKVLNKEGVIMRIPLKEKESMSKGKYDVRVFNASASVSIDGKMEAAKISSSSSIIEIR